MTDAEILKAHQARITQCKTCRASIIWFDTPKGKRMPVNAETVQPADTALDLAKHISHFSSCPDAIKHRRAR